MRKKIGIFLTFLQSFYDIRTASHAQKSSLQIKLKDCYYKSRASPAAIFGDAKTYLCKFLGHTETINLRMITEGYGA